MKLLFVLLFLIILVFIIHNSTYTQNIRTSIKNNRITNIKYEKIPDIKYDEHGTIDTLPIIKKLPNLKDDSDILIENQFNLHKMNLNRWNYGKSDFAPYINGSYKQNTNNYVPNYKFNNNQDFSTNKNNRINIWKN